MDTMPPLAVAPGPRLLVLLPFAFGQALILFGVASFAGVALASRLQLRCPIMDCVVAARRPPSGVWRRLLFAAALGAALGLTLALLDRSIFREAAAVSSQGTENITLLTRLVAGMVYGGINEEVLMRLFLVSLVAWTLTRGWRRGPLQPPGRAVMSASIVLVALLFGVGHLPAASAMGGLTPGVVTRVVVLNGLGGVVFGWLFWRRGLESAMIAHALAHVPLQLLAVVSG